MIRMVTTLVSLQQLMAVGAPCCFLVLHCLFCNWAEVLLISVCRLGLWCAIAIQLDVCGPV
jgi:hypothetical protein